MVNTLENFPKYSEVITSIAKLKGMSFPKLENSENVEKYIENILGKLDSEFGGIPNIISVLNPTDFPMKIFRARELKSFSNINLFPEHSYTPVNLTKMGRCNFPNYPVFYGSDDPMTALIEVVRENDNSKNKYCISKWELLPSEKEFIFQSFLEIDLPSENLYNELNKIQINKINKLFSQSIDPETRKGLIEYLKFLNTSFILDNNYSISASLAHRILYPKKQYATDILMYPSVQTKLKGANFAIHPNFVDNQMIITRFYIVEFENYNSASGKINVSIVKYGEVIKNQIK